MITSSSLWGRGLNFSFVNDKLRVPYQGIRAEKQGHYSFTKGLLFLNIHIWFWKVQLGPRWGKTVNQGDTKLCFYAFSLLLRIHHWLDGFNYLNMVSCWQLFFMISDECWGCYAHRLCLLVHPCPVSCNQRLPPKCCKLSSLLQFVLILEVKPYTTLRYEGHAHSHIGISVEKGEQQSNI
jgi:hypothetical protein